MHKFALMTLACLTLPMAAQGAGILYSQDFDVDSSAGWAFNSSLGATDLKSDGKGGEANFYFDYGAVGIPSATHSTGGTTIGMKIQANTYNTTTNAAGATFSGISVSPLGVRTQKDFKLSFDAWGNFQGPMPGGGNGTTEFYGAGVGRGETTAQFPGGTLNGVMAVVTPDGGSATDYRFYNAPGAAVTTGYAATSQDSANAYYNTFTGSVPAAQTTYANNSLSFASQTGSPAVGSQSFAWRYWEIERIGDILTWSIDGKLIATQNVAGKVLDNDDIFFSFFDSNATGSNQPISNQLLFGLIDNVVVTPEPTSLVALGAVSILGLRRRK